MKTVVPVGGPEVLVDGKRLITFSSNDYLGLSQHPLVKSRSIEYVGKYGAGSGGSRLVSGNIDAFDKLEQQLAQIRGAEAALIFNSGYHCNATVLSCLLDEHTRCFLDRYCHNSMLLGVLASKSKWARFQHNDLDDLARCLRKSGVTDLSQAEKLDDAHNGPYWIVTESVFSMDGDQADIGALVELARQTGACTYVDEAHATGVLGPQGMGLATAKDVDIIMGTFGKGAGSFGAYIICNRDIREYLLSSCAGLLYTTALPPAVLGAIDAALELMPLMENERRLLQAKAAELREKLTALGFGVGNSSTQIVPVIVGSDLDAVDLKEHLEQNGILAPALCAPTVPTGTARLRLSLNIAHTDSHIEHLLKVLKTWRDKKQVT